MRFSVEEMQAALTINIPTYLSAIVTKGEIVDSISSAKSPAHKPIPCNQEPQRPIGAVRDPDSRSRRNFHRRFIAQPAHLRRLLSCDAQCQREFSRPGRQVFHAHRIRTSPPINWRKTTCVD